MSNNGHKMCILLKIHTHCHYSVSIKLTAFWYYFNTGYIILFQAKKSGRSHDKCNFQLFLIWIFLTQCDLICGYLDGCGEEANIGVDTTFPLWLPVLAVVKSNSSKLSDSHVREDKGKIPADCTRPDGKWLNLEQEKRDDKVCPVYHFCFFLFLRPRFIARRVCTQRGDWECIQRGDLLVWNGIQMDFENRK